MRAEYQELNSRLEDMDREELILSIRRLMEESCEKDAQLDILSSASEEMAKQFKQAKTENEALKKENRELLKQNRKLTEQLQMRKKDLFGRKSEKTSGIMDFIMDEDEPADPIEETPADDTAGNKATDGAAKESAASHGGRQKGHSGRKTSGKRARDLSKLPKKTVFEYDIDDLNRRYGEGNWRFAFWHKEDTIETIHTMHFHKEIYRPVVSVGLEHELECPYPCEKILPGSLASSSLIAEVMYQKTVQCVPSYRLEADFIRSDVPVSRQNMTSWINRFSNDLLVIVAEHMEYLLLSRGHNQCDETPYQVICDNRKAGSKSFMWVHTTSELDPGHPIIVYKFELTRSAEHLRKFYLDTGYTGLITSDAFSSYQTLEDEANGLITISGCLMHARRRFSYAVMLIKGKGLTEEELLKFPEVKCLRLIDAINDADKPLKDVSPEKRYYERQRTVREKVSAFFDYIKTLDEDNPEYSEKFKDAIQYSLNQEEKLCRFLDNSLIPIDNGFCERHIKPFATLRNNCLFSYSIDGANAAAILFTLVETAKANNAHPYYYLKYLLETLSNNTINNMKKLMDDCMPWSEAYRNYEIREKESTVKFFTDQAIPEKPKTPRKKEQCA